MPNERAPCQPNRYVNNNVSRHEKFAWRENESCERGNEKLLLSFVLFHPLELPRQKADRSVDIRDDQSKRHVSRIAYSLAHYWLGETSLWNEYTRVTNDENRVRLDRHTTRIRAAILSGYWQKPRFPPPSPRTEETIEARDSEEQESHRPNPCHESREGKVGLSSTTANTRFRPRWGALGQLARFHDASPGAGTGNGTSAALSPLQLVARRTSTS